MSSIIKPRRQPKALSKDLVVPHHGLPGTSAHVPANGLARDVVVNYPALRKARANTRRTLVLAMNQARR